ncbi:ankyrin repeat-containing domain protein [Penicillium verrucosum]|uniref:ankyrin repeat-containing domain protein n=1 Tax=Penicillium verrucosum TaxID=60171 RepID=UPI0025456C94|nr:ankyrin repeat-containing domain protein [Penicillium verrucosum]KAJ5942073.1 ankyrin repeat-containing domain protein [Penicillium verrucosum]
MSQEGAFMSRENYTVGWVCALPKEMVAATAMLDEVHPPLSQPLHDSNNYRLGRIGHHNIVIACLPLGVIGNNSSATVATRLTSTFPRIRVGLMVGIGGGVPTAVRLGDVVVSAPEDSHGGVIQWDFGKAEQGQGFRRVGSLDSPPTILKTTLAALRVRHEMEGPQIPEFLDTMERKWPRLAPKYTRRETLEDTLFPSEYQHVDTEPDQLGDDQLQSCSSCDYSKAIRRIPRDMRVHYGLIASGNQVIKDGKFRDEVNSQLGGKVLCFEMESAGLMNDFRCIVIRGICDYADSHKNKAWQEYAAAVAAATAKEFLLLVPGQELAIMPPMVKVLDHVEQIQLDMTSMKDVLQDLDDADLLQRISDLDPAADHKRARSKHVPTTGQWLLQDDSYISWAHGNERLLWLYGIPGSGKTMLSSTVINDIQKTYQHDQGTRIAFFYFDVTDSRKRTAEGCIRSILRQISAPRPPEAVKALYVRARRISTQPTVASILCVLKEILKSLKRCFMVIDGLDECDDIGTFLETLVSINAVATVNLLVTSPLWPSIQRAMSTRGAIRIEIEMSRIEKDVHTYTHQRLYGKEEFSGRWPKELKKRIHQSLVLKAAGLFRLAECQLREIERCYSYHDLEVALHTLPTSLGNIYDQMLDQIPLKRRKQAQFLLMWLAFPMRPLLLEEASELFALKFNGTSPRLDPRRRVLDPQGILSICPGVITVAHKDSGKPDDSSGQLVVKLAHASVKDYLISCGSPPDESKKWYSLDENLAHHSIAITCLHYLSQLNTPNAITSKLQGDYPLAQYAAQFWPSHARSASAKDGFRLQLLMEDVFVFHGNVFTNWIRIHDLDEPWRTRTKPLDVSFTPFLPSPLYIASLIGLDTVVSCILSNEPEILTTEGVYGNALHAAAAKGHSRVVKLLLNSSVPVDTTGLYGTALQTAAYEGQAGVCHVLLNSNADIHARSDEFGNPLEAAIYGGHIEVVQVLLDRGADITKPGRHYVDSLHTACTLGNLDIVELLLDQRKINPLSQSYNLALQTSSDRGFSQIYALLQTFGPDPKARDELYGTALHAAVADGYTQIVKLMLEQKQEDINAVNEEHGTPLCIASTTGNEEIVQLLLNSGANPRIQCSAGTPLHIASSLGHLGVAKTLLKTTKASMINSIGGNFGTPLQAACYRGHVEVAKLLLHSGADPNLPAGRYISALHAAACGICLSAHAQTETVQVLLDYGADVNIVSEEFGTPVQAALSCGNFRVVKLLERYGG